MKITIDIPTDLSEVTLAQYQHFLKVSSSIDGMLLKQRKVECFCGVKLSDVMLMPYLDVEEISSHIDKLLSEENISFQQRFNIKDVKFGMIPNLENISFGEFVDLSTYVGDWSTMNKAMAVLFRPVKNEVKDKYSIVDYTGSEDFSELMKYMPLSVVLGSLSFFFLLGDELIKDTQTSLAKELEKTISQKLHNSVNDGDGINQYTLSLEESYKDLIKSLSTNYINA